MKEWIIASSWGLPILILIGFICVGYAIQTIFIARLNQLSKKTETKIDDWLVNALRGHILWWFFLLGLVTSLKFVTLDTQLFEVVRTVALGLFFVSLTISVSRFFSGFVRDQAQRLSISLPLTSLTSTVVKVIIFSIGALLILSNLGISIAPVLTALGVGSLAVALALQDTLSNIFAGLHILISGQIRVGDFVKLDTGNQGYVMDIGWRATRIRELPNNMIIVPNSKLSQAVVINYYLPEKGMAVVFQAGVSYSSDLKKVEAVTIDVARQAQATVHGAVRDFTPFIRYHTFGDSSINFSIILRVEEVVDQYLLVHEFVKMLHERYNQEGIEIPFPQRVVWQKTSN